VTETYSGENIFAKIIRGEIPAHRVFEDADHLVIMDIFPQSRGHSLVIPKAPSRNLLDAAPDTLASSIRVVQSVANAAKQALEADGIRIMQFNEAAAGQTVFHLHFHVIPIYTGTQVSAHAQLRADDAELATMADAIRKAMI
jgi:histidine triad (HIT) family protein